MSERRSSWKYTRFLGSVVAVVYAIIAGFMVITLWEQYVTAGDTVQNETVTHRDGVRFSGAFGPVAQGKIRQLVVRYANSVATVEWQSMANGDGSPVAQNNFDQLITAIQGLNVHNPTQEEFLSTMLAQVDDVGKERQQRLELSGRWSRTCVWQVELAPANPNSIVLRRILWRCVINVRQAGLQAALRDQPS